MCLFDSCTLLGFGGLSYMSLLFVFCGTAVNENKTTVAGGCNEMQCEENVGVFLLTGMA